MSTRANQELDPYTANAEKTNLSPQAKIDAFKGVIKTVKTAMLTTRSADGSLHSRAMTPSSPHSPTQLSMVFIGNNASHKFDEIENDGHVNVSFYDESSTNWASVSGIARITQDKELIKKHWSAITAGYFGDLGDGIHKGDENDPRVSLIEVAISAVTGHGHAPGDIITISKPEIQLTQGINAA